MRRGTMTDFAPASARPPCGLLVAAGTFLALLVPTAGLFDREQGIRYRPGHVAGRSPDSPATSPGFSAASSRMSRALSSRGGRFCPRGVLPPTPRSL